MKNKFEVDCSISNEELGSDILDVIKSHKKHPDVVKATLANLIQIIDEGLNNGLITIEINPRMN